ncbi:uncharacterized protein F5891DRAFT_980627 [Suillus fuscotomentosus]|uniref:Uncharacterized protein n=1 Tax=Suillus fuscotomentosus TaxID=1912939 RepID=A0AAD4HKZ4_9AGAM|nr:uncharacterized protein F5891DRAFT_980627 [Suillus fuscotomentosus]KAG1900011.1 hypothetical protein F5891DRAFT_980627 [Suillus fuscotomentosus]
MGLLSVITTELRLTSSIAKENCVLLMLWVAILHLQRLGDNVLHLVVCKFHGSIGFCLIVGSHAHDVLVANFDISDHSSDNETSSFFTGYDNFSQDQDIAALDQRYATQSSGNTDDWPDIIESKDDITISHSIVDYDMLRVFTGDEKVPVETAEPFSYDTSSSPSAQQASFDCNYDDDDGISMSQALPVTANASAKPVADTSKPPMLSVPFVHYSDETRYLQHEFSPRQLPQTSFSDEDNVPTEEYLAEMSEADKVFLGYGHMLAESMYRTLLGLCKPRPASGPTVTNEPDSKTNHPDGRISVDTPLPCAVDLMCTGKSADDVFMADLYLGYEEDYIATAPQNPQVYRAGVEQSPQILLPADLDFGYEGDFLPITPLDRPVHPTAIESLPDIELPANLDFGYEEKIFSMKSSDDALQSTLTEPSPDCGETIQTTSSDEALPTTSSNHLVWLNDIKASTDPSLPADLCLGYEDEALPTIASNSTIGPTHINPSASITLPGDLCLEYEDEAIMKELSTQAVLASQVENLGDRAAPHVSWKSPRTADGLQNHDPLYADAAEAIAHVIDHLEVNDDHESIGNCRETTAKEMIYARRVVEVSYTERRDSITQACRDLRLEEEQDRNNED